MDDWPKTLLLLIGAASCLVGFGWLILPRALDLYEYLWLHSFEASEKIAAAQRAAHQRKHTERRDEFAKDVGVRLEK